MFDTFYVKRKKSTNKERNKKGLIARNCTLNPFYSRDVICFSNLSGTEEIKYSEQTPHSLVHGCITHQKPHVPIMVNGIECRTQRKTTTLKIQKISLEKS